MSKKICWITIILFTAFIGVFFLVNLILPDRDFSEQENRYLTQAPKFSFKELFSGGFTADFEKYTTDQFVLRDQWITMKAASELALGKRENNGVYYSGGTLINDYTAPHEAQLQENVSHINALAANTDVPVYLALIPSAAEVQSEKLPANAPVDSQQQVIDSVYEATDAETVDIYSALTSHSDEYIFYRTDHHWTTLGAFYAYETLCDSLGVQSSPLSSYERKTVSDSFYGTAYSSSGFTWVEPDEIVTFVQPYEGLNIQNWSTGMAKDGVLYDESFLEKKDKYSYFFGGNTPLLEIDTGNEGGTLLIIRDSYTDSLTPFFFENYSRICVMDLRYYRASLSQYIADQNVDSVLVCYSIDNFSTDTNLFLLGR